jgi:hypothetical protein
VLPEKIASRDLYKLIALRLKPFLKAPVSSLEPFNNLTSNNFEENILSEEQKDGSKLSKKYISDSILASKFIPEFGFTLRTVTGGISGTGTSCSRCPWLMRCQGCTIDQDEMEFLHLRDGESIAIDWHFVVYEDLLDSFGASYIHRQNLNSISQNSNNSSLDINKCLDKFTEEVR